ncbi:MAG TPA: glycosyltransferase family 39 protein [Isosphaeraceae bacterium]|nr:glycosyltransferase family 39 protein [Isosphaeraceae bacterium]
MLLDRDVEGLLWSASLLALLATAAERVVRRAFGMEGLARGLGAGVLAWAWATLGMMALGPVGLVNRWGLLAWVGLGWLVAMVSGGRPRPARKNVAADRRWEWAATVALGMMIWPAAVFGAVSLLGPVKVVSDGPIYHLYFAARWWKAGRVFLVPVPFGEGAATYFPGVGELDFAWLMTAWGGDRLAKVGQAPFLLLGGLSIFGLARRLGASTPSATIAACWFATCSPFLFFTFEPNVDTIFVAGYLAAVYFAIRHALGDDDGPALLLAGLAAGGAWGTKPTGTVFVPPLLAVIGVIILAKGSPWRRRLLRLGILMVGPLLLAIPWFVRNAWLTGNPLYPLQVELFGKVWLRGWYDARAMRNSVYYLPPDDWRSFLGLAGQVFDPRLAPAWLLALGGAWRIGRRGRPEDRWVWAIAGLAVANLALAWWLIPYRTQQRFLFHAVGLAAVPLALLLDRGRWLRWAAAGLLILHVLTGHGWFFGLDGFDLRMMSWGDGSKVPTSGLNLAIVGTDHKGLLHIRIFDGRGKRVTDADETQFPDKAAAIATLKQQLPGLLPPHVLTDSEKRRVIGEATSIVGQTRLDLFGQLRRLSPRVPIMTSLVTLPTGPDSFSPVIAALPGVGALIVAWTWGRAVRVTSLNRRAIALSTSLAFAIAIGLLVSHATSESPFRDFPDFEYFRGWKALDALAGPRGARIAYAGTNIPYYLFGKGLRNDVRYVNLDRHRGWLLHSYHKAAGSPNWPDSRPGWDRLPTDYDAWLANLRAESIDYLVVARANPAEGRHLPFADDPLGFTVERYWAETHPDVFEPVYGVAENDPRFRVFRIRHTGRDTGRH